MHTYELTIKKVMKTITMVTKRKYLALKTYKWVVNHVVFKVSI